MRALVQRVRRADVRVADETVGRIGLGLLVLLGVEQGDTEQDLQYMVDKVAGLRVFEDADQKMNLSVGDVKGGVLVVSQFTLLGDCRKGRRPGFTDAAPPEQARLTYLKFAKAIEDRGIEVATGRFQAEMDVELVNMGPVTLMIDSRKRF